MLFTRRALLLLLATLLGQAMNNYLFLDYFKNAKALSYVNLISVGGTLILAPFVSRIAENFGKSPPLPAQMIAEAVTDHRQDTEHRRRQGKTQRLYHLIPLGICLIHRQGHQNPYHKPCQRGPSAWEER